MFRVRIAHALALLALPAQLLAQATKALPLKHRPQPTTATISAPDLMTRLYIFADDSMQGRETGTIGHVKSTNYIANELKRLGLEPAGDSGFFQNVPIVRRSLDPASTILVNNSLVGGATGPGVTLKAGTDFVATSRGNIKSIDGLIAVYAGVQGDTTSPALTAEQASGKFLVYRAPAATGRGRGRGGFGGGRGGRGGRGGLAQAAGAVATVAESLSALQVRTAFQPIEGDVFLKPADSAAAQVPTITVSAHGAEAIFGAPADQLAKGRVGGVVHGNLIFHDAPAPARNLVAIIRGSDPKLKGEFVAMGAHNDHVGLLQNQGADHDSLHLYNQARFGITGMYSNRGGPQPSDSERALVAAIKLNLDSIRRVRPVRMDSIRNGADDDGSGSVTLLELAEAFQKAPQKPKRSLIFVWHVGEEKGLWGSRYFADHTTVPRDSIVAQLNMDMVGRGDKVDLPVGSPTYLQLVGSRRLSKELGDMVESVSKTEKMPFTFDYQFDADGHPENIYCRSDHANYARYGIPVVFFTTGLHGDYHQISDEPQYIDYDHMARVGQLVYDVAVRVANLDHRVVVDPKPDSLKPSPTAPCRQ
jgi:hypothetical protein